MAVKRRMEKKKYRQWLEKNAFKIMCKYCDNYGTCKNRINKENNEKDTITRCTHTPNKKVKKTPWEKTNKNGEVINVNKNGIPRNRWMQEEYNRNENKENYTHNKDNGYWKKKKFNKYPRREK